MSEGDLRERLRAGDRIAGCWMRTPAPVIAELLAFSPLDTVCLDAEHGPFDRQALDGCLAIFRATNKPALVRVAAQTPEHILAALDCGANGVVVPHVKTAAEAAAVAKAARFGSGGRGYAGNTRWAGFGAHGIADNLTRSATETAVIAQIEDAEAIDNIDAIAAVPDIDALFIGRMDLTVALGATDPQDTRVLAAIDAVCQAAARHGRTVGMFLPNPQQVPHWAAKGVSLFLLSSDQAFIRSGAAALAHDIAGGQA